MIQTLFSCNDLPHVQVNRVKKKKIKLMGTISQNGIKKKPA
jgi:hypothetical protein